MNAEDLLNQVGDDALRNIATEAAGNIGVTLGGAALDAVVAAIKQGVRDAWAEATRSRDVQEMVRFEMQKFWRQIGGRPNGYRTL